LNLSWPFAGVIQTATRPFNIGSVNRTELRKTTPDIE